ncbi:MAG TPA: RNA polymerase sigma factor [Myxococcaceae bacterium]|jgi:RNA polymerase sigma-70 factor (ECF subfamily)
MRLLAHRIRDVRLAWLLARSQRGDRHAFRRLYRLLHGPVSRYVRRRVRPAPDAEDVVAEVFTRLVESLDRIDARRITVLAYALTAARNAVVDRARRGGASLDPLSLPAPEPVPDPGARLEARQALDALRACVERQPGEVREMLSLRFADGLRHGEIAAVMELSEAAVRQRLSRVVRELRAQLGASTLPEELANGF